VTTTPRFETTRRSRRRRTFVPAAALTVGALALAGCASGDAHSASSPTFPTGQTITVTLIAPSPAQEPANAYLKETFEQEFPGNKLVFKDEQWATYQADYGKELIDGKGAIPDVVEMGNTQTPGFTATGALLDLTDKYEDLGGKDLLQGFVDIGTYGGKFYAPPYYAGARVVLASADVVGATVPTSLDQFVAQAKKLKKSDFSGFFLPGEDWYNVLPFVWENGGFIAKEVGGTWQAGFSSPGGIRGLKQVQEVFKAANSQKVAPAHSDEAQAAEVFCEGKVGYLAGPTWLSASIEAPASAKPAGCPTTAGKDLTAFALPGKQAGTVAKTFAGGSNLGIPAKSKNPALAYQALKIMTSSGYQDLLALQGFIPARISSAQHLPQDTTTLQGAKAAQNAELTPASPRWADVETKRYLQNAFAKIAAGADVTTTAKALDKQIEATLNG
jgi:N,N'-diacetylchitobiose transport system substrate-binding protein